MFNYQAPQGYSSVPYYQPRFYAPQPMPLQQAEAYQMPGQSLIKVNGRAGAEAYQMPGPNSMAALFDANDDIFYLKSTDGAGYPTVTAYRFTAVTEAPAAEDDVVRRSEFDAFKSELQEALKNVQQLVQRRKPAAAADAE